MSLGTTENLIINMKASWQPMVFWLWPQPKTITKATLPGSKEQKLHCTRFWIPAPVSATEKSPLSVCYINQAAKHNTFSTSSPLLTWEPPRNIQLFTAFAGTVGRENIWQGKGFELNNCWWRTHNSDYMKLLALLHFQAAGNCLDAKYCVLFKS